MSDEFMISYIQEIRDNLNRLLGVVQIGDGTNKAIVGADGSLKVSVTSTTPGVSSDVKVYDASGEPIGSQGGYLQVREFSTADIKTAVESVDDKFSSEELGGNNVVRMEVVDSAGDQIEDFGMASYADSVGSDKKALVDSDRHVQTDVLTIPHDTLTSADGVSVYGFITSTASNRILPLEGYTTNGGAYGIPIYSYWKDGSGNVGLMPGMDVVARAGYQVVVEKVPTDGSKTNPSQALNYTAGILTSMTKVIGGVTFTKTFGYSAGILNSISAWS